MPHVESWFSFLYLVFLFDIFLGCRSLLVNTYLFPLDLICFLYSSFTMLSRYWCPQSNAYSFTFTSSLLHYDAFIHDCNRYIPNGPIFLDYSPTSIDEFLSSFYVVHQMKTCANVTSTATTAIPDHYTSLIPSSALYKRILFKARALIPSITDYNEFIPLSNH